MAYERRGRQIERYVMMGRKSHILDFEKEQVINEDAFAAMDKKDLAHAVLTAFDTLKRLRRMPVITKQQKNREITNNYIIAANSAFNNENYQLTQILLNKALCYAPDAPRILLIYNIRSHLAQTTMAYEAAAVDIKRCLSLISPDQSDSALKDRLEECSDKYLMEKLTREPTSSEVENIAKLFDLKSINPQIPVASEDVAVRITPHTKTVIAARNIKVGTVVAREPASVIQYNDGHKYLACSYCCTLTITLIPCPNCTGALYCNEQCMEKAFDEYHEIECQIIDVVRKISVECRMALKAVLKMIQMCKSWDKFIASSFEYGMEKLKNSSVTAAFCGTTPFSLLSFRDDREIASGELYNTSFDCAVVLHYLGNIPNFFPQCCSKKIEAMNAIARVMLALAMFNVPTLLSSKVQIGCTTQEHYPVKHAWFPFISKLRNECYSNLVPITLHKEVALVAVQPIHQGTELTIPYLGHFLDNNMDQNHRNRATLILMGKNCDCLVCSSDGKSDNQITAIQQENLQRLDIDKAMQTFSANTVSSLYPKLCEALSIVSQMPFLKEYKIIYELFRNCHNIFQSLKYPQYLVDRFNETQALHRSLLYDDEEEEGRNINMIPLETQEVPILTCIINGSYGGSAA